MEIKLYGERSMAQKKEELTTIKRSTLEDEYKKYFVYLNPDEKRIKNRKLEADKEIKTWVSHNTVMYQHD